LTSSDFSIVETMNNTKRRTYHLEVCPGTSLQGPTDQEVESAIRGLSGGVPSFVILTKKKNHFMQAGGSSCEGFHLEFMEFSHDGLWEYADSNGRETDVETTVNALVSYARDDESWRDLPWKRLPPEVSDARSQKAMDDWQSKQPHSGFFRTAFRCMLGFILIELGIVGKSKRR
jgi:transposase